MMTIIVMFVKKKSGKTAIVNVENGSKLLLECWKIEQIVVENVEKVEKSVVENVVLG